MNGIDTATASTAPDFNLLVLPLQAELYSVALRYTRNERDAEDLLQETLLKAFVAWKNFVPQGSPRGWCYRILTNTFITGYRRRTTERRAVQTEERELRCLTSAASRRAAENPEISGAARSAWRRGARSAGLPLC